MQIETAFTSAALIVVASAAGGAWLYLSAIRPRLLLYVLFALLPTQFLFLPVSTFFVSPADVMIVAAAAALVLRCIEGRTHALAALREHAWLGIMLLAYVAGFLVLEQSSRTLVRVFLAFVPSILACDLLRERRHLARAAAALVVSGLVDGAYGLMYYSRGIWLHPTRFSGMSGVNFSAIVMTMAAVVALARFARTRQPVKLGLPLSLAALGVATLSKAAVFAMAAAWVLVLQRVMTRVNRWVIVAPAVAVVVFMMALPTVRERVLAREERAVQADGVARNSNDVRWLILRTAWAGFSSNPIVGVGYSNFQQYSNTSREIRISTGGQGYGTHNTYLEILVEGGVLALLPFVLHFAQFVRRFPLAWKAIARRRDPLVGAVAAAFVVVILAGAFANVLIHYSFWAVTGTMLACLNLLSRERTNAA